jgi:hypothetical protein
LKIDNIIAEHLEPESEVLTGLFQLIVAGRDFPDIVNGSTLEIPDIFVEIVNRSEFHSAASLNKAAAPNSSIFDQRPSVHRRELPNPPRVVIHERHEDRRRAAIGAFTVPRRTG